MKLSFKRLTSFQLTSKGLCRNKMVRLICLLSVLLLVTFLVSSSDSVTATKILDKNVSGEQTDRLVEERQQIRNEQYLARISRALSRLYRLLNFFETDWRSINLDGLFGIRIAQGKLLFTNKSTKKVNFLLNFLFKGVFNKLNQVQKFKGLDEVLNYKLKLSVHVINKRIIALANKTTDVVKNQEPQYWNAFKLLVDRPYDPKVVQKVTGIVDGNYRKSFNNSRPERRFDEKLSDACLTLLMKDIETKSCGTDTDCFQYFLIENASGKIIQLLDIYLVNCISEHSISFSRVFPYPPIVVLHNS